MNRIKSKWAEYDEEPSPAPVLLTSSPGSTTKEYKPYLAKANPYSPSPKPGSLGSPYDDVRSPSLEDDKRAILARKAKKELEDDPIKLWDRINEKPCDEIIPGFLFVSGEANAGYMDVTEKKHGFHTFTHVVSLRGKIHTSVFSYTVAALPVAVGDAHKQDISQHLDTICDFIKQARKYPNAKLLVHCKHGVSRSGTSVLYYLMKEQGMSLRDACIYVKKGRKDICPNRGFFMQLQECEMRLRDIDRPSVTCEEGRKHMWCSCTKFEELITEPFIRDRTYPIKLVTTLIKQENTHD